MAENDLMKNMFTHDTLNLIDQNCQDLKSINTEIEIFKVQMDVTAKY